ncbi:MAG: hypothetical protein JXR63_03925 [Spirochaetales bacterium]|nr:hypothetical protein [Spirochaetales bacterium]
MEYQIFKTSEEFIKTQKKVNLAMYILFPILIIIAGAIPLIISGDMKENFKLFLLIIGIMFVIIEIITFIMSKIVFRALENNEILLSEHEIIRQNKKVKETIKISDINKIFIRENRKNKIHFIRIFFDKKSITIQGIEKIEEFCESLETLTSSNEDKKETKKKPFLIDPLSLPYKLCLSSFMFFFGLVPALTFLALGNDKGFQIFVSMTIITGGGNFLLTRPLSTNSGKVFSKFETIMGIFLIIIGLANIII